MFGTVGLTTVDSGRGFTPNVHRRYTYRVDGFTARQHEIFEYSNFPLSIFEIVVGPSCLAKPTVCLAPPTFQMLPPPVAREHNGSVSHGSA